MLCFYHSADLDGKCSAAIVKYVYPDCVLYPYNYGDPLPTIECFHDTVFIVDIFFPIEKMKEIKEKVKTLFWIDHHVSSINTANENKLSLDGIQKSGKAACELTWEFLSKYLGKKISQNIPEAVTLLGRYDVWDINYNDDVLPFQYGMRTEKTDPQSLLWKTLFDTPENPGLHTIDKLETIEEKGEIIIEYEKLQAKEYLNSHSFTTKIKNYNALVVNRGKVNSLFFNSHFNPNLHDLVCSFAMSNNQNWYVSFYTTKDNVDCSKLAQEFGGGGHKQAAGYSGPNLPFLLPSPGFLED